MLKTSPPLMMDAPITNYHATSVRTNHNIYHVSCHTPRSLRVAAAAATTTPASDDRQTGPHQQQATTASTSTLIDPPASIKLLFSHGYHLSSQVVQSACRAYSQSSFASGVRPTTFGSQRTLSSSTVEDGGCPTFLLSLRLRQRDLVCLLDSGLDDLLLFG